MTLNFLDLYNECAGQPWSMFDNDATDKEDFESSMRISINKAISFLWNLQPWSFRERNKTVRTRSGDKYIKAPLGQLIKKTIAGSEKYGIKCDGKFLSYEPSYELLEDKEGEPEYFYISNGKIYLYPTPDNSYTIDITYLLLPYGLTEDGEQIQELKENEDYVNIGSEYETLFKNCLISKAMLYAIADESDENYSGYLVQYEDALNILTDYCKNGIVDKNIVW